MAVTTNGWGAVNAASIEVVNRSIEKQKKIPSGFCFTSEGSILGIKIKCAVCGEQGKMDEPGKWSKWEIIEGGSGEILYMSCIVEKAFAFVEAAESKWYDISGSSVNLSLELKSISDINSTADGEAQRKDSLVADTGRAVQILNTTKINGLDETEDQIIIDLIKDGFADYLNGHLADFTAAFGVVMINRELAEKQKDFQWLMPTEISYAVERTNTGNNYFGILTMIDNDKISSQSQQLDTRVFDELPNEANSVLMISPEKFCQHILLPSAVSIMTGSREEDFIIGEDGLVITNQNELTWDKFKLGDGSVIQPQIPKGSFEIKVEGDEIVIEILGMHYSPSAGITIKMNLTQKVKVVIEDRGDGKYVLAVDTKSAFNHSELTTNVEVAEWLEIAEIVLDVVSAVAALVCGVGAIAEKVAARATTTVMEEATAEVVIGEKSIEEVARGETMAVEESMAISAAEIAGGAAEKTAGFFASNTCKLVQVICGVIAAAGGISIGVTELVKYCEKKEYDKLPLLENFANILLGNYVWPEMSETKIVGGRLMDTLQVYTKIDD